MSQNGYVPMDELTLNSLWNERVRPTGEPVAGSDRLDPAMVTTVDRMQSFGTVLPPASSRERVRESVRANVQSSIASQKESSMFANPAQDRAITLTLPSLPPASVGPRVGPRLGRPPGSRRWLIAQAAAALLILAVVIGGILLLTDRGDGNHPAVAPASPSPSAVSSSSWLQYRNGPAHVGGAGSNGPQTPHERWQIQTDGPISSEPAIANGVLYSAGSDGFLRAMDTISGAELWRFDGDIELGTTPAVGESLVYVVVKNLQLHAIDRADGEVVWSFGGANHEASPTLVGDVLYQAGDDDRLYAFEAVTGEVLWSFDTGAETGRTAGYADGTVYIGTATGQLFAINTATGEERWRFDHIDGIALSTVIAGEVVYQSFYQSSDNRLYAIDASTGEPIWSFATQTNDILWVPSLNDTLAISTSDDGNVYALDRETGAERWRVTVAGIGESTGTTDQRAVYLTDTSGYLYALDLEHGAELWRFPIDGGGVKGPALVDGVLYISTLAGQILAIEDTEDGVIAAPTVEGSLVETSPAASPLADPGTTQVALIWSSTGSATTPLDAPTGLAVAPNGNLYVVNSMYDTIEVVSPTGEHLQTIGSTGNGPGQFSFHLGSEMTGGTVDLDADGNIYVFDPYNGRVQKLSSDGTFLLEWTTDGMEEPYGSVDRATGRVYVADMSGRVQVFDLDGKLIDSFGEHGSGPGQLSIPGVPLVDHDGNIWVPDYDNRVVTKFDADGNYLLTLDDGFININWLGITEDGAIIVPDIFKGSIGFYRTDGTLIGEITQTPDGETIRPNSAEAGKDGVLYVTNTRPSALYALEIPAQLASEGLPIPVLGAIF